MMMVKVMGLLMTKVTQKPMDLLRLMDLPI
jgi:hypothetical protein